MNNYREILIDELEINPFTSIGNEWMLISAGDVKQANTMTASWGGLGHLWHKNVAFVFIRPQRYTKEFVDNNDYFSLCFFDNEYKKDLEYLGTVSGRDFNKVENTDIHFDFINEVPVFKEAKLIIICKKVYKQFINNDNFIDVSLDKECYPERDYHEMYVGEITKILVR